MKLSPRTPFEICILAGGLSTRMGRDKAQLRLGNRTLLSHIRATAKSLGLPVRLIRRDAVPRCGPLGGIVTAMRSTHAKAILFLACDMPFVSADLLRELLDRARQSGAALFTEDGCTAGFPIVLRRTTLPLVEQQIAFGELSIQSLAVALKARTLKTGRRFTGQLRNINTPADWQAARERWKSR
jgi:molybdopterin-guanine dinucleotide biosynthesis protein A